MPQSRPRLGAILRAAALGALALAVLGGCATRVKVKTSPAVMELRAHAKAQRAGPAATYACPAADAPQAEKVAIEFGFLEASLDNVAKAWLDEAARELKCPGATIQLTGEADSHGTADEQAALSARRVDAARQYLMAAGVAAERFTTTASDPRTLRVVAGGRGW